MSTNPNWAIERTYQHEGMDIEIKRDLLSSRAPVRIVSARQGGQIHSEHVQHSTWEGHCSGQLWLPDFYQRAKAAVSKLDTQFIKRTFVLGYLREEDVPPDLRAAVTTFWDRNNCADSGDDSILLEISESEFPPADNPAAVALRDFLKTLSAEAKFKGIGELVLVPAGRR
jgi:hypothetical protein